MSDLKSVHAVFVVSGHSDDPLLTGRLVKFCALSPTGCLSYALHLQSNLSAPSSFTLNTVLKAFIRKSRPSDAIAFFKSSPAPPNHYTVPLLVNAAAHLGNIHQGEIFHALTIKLGFESVIPVLNSLIDMYASCDGLDLARQVFNEMPDRDVVSYTSLINGYTKAGHLDAASSLFWEMPNRNVVSWNTLLCGYVHNRRFWKGLWLFRQMLEMHFEPDDATLVSILSASGHLKTITYGKSVHALLIRKWFDVPVHVGTALVEFYCKCGLLKPAVLVFARMEELDLICWNALISGVATQGPGEDAIGLFQRMLNAGIRPDDITFVGILTACAHSGLVNEGLHHFEMMTSVFGIKPRFVHYWCLVDLFVRLDNIDKALNVIREMPLDNLSSVWSAIIAVAKICGSTDVGEYLGKQLIKLEPYNRKRYLPLLNLYAAAQRWDKYNEVQKLMKERGLRSIESTLIDLNIIAHDFSVGDRNQPEMDKIYSVLEGMAKKLNMQLPCTDIVSGIPGEV
ncbi:pentatricopeptide repeat-containing protein At5g66520-like [Aristolochia californica]|uniref:pentatricopeptide repeat-containing protein At5g66520-like n=1 Tax=Aristolochia californica TaxID=171875 RepID=UPI0035E1FCAF